MQTLKLFFLICSLVQSLSRIVILTEKYNHEKTLDLFSKIYDTLLLMEYIDLDKSKFITLIDKHISIIRTIVDIVWYIYPPIFHNLTWRAVGFQRDIWLSIVAHLSTYAQETEQQLREKIEYYTHQYNLKVATNLIEKDLEVAIMMINLKTKQSIKEQILKQKKVWVEPPPEDNDWIEYIDTEGKIHTNPNRDPVKEWYNKYGKEEKE